MTYLLKKCLFLRLFIQFTKARIYIEKKVDESFMILISKEIRFFKNFLGGERFLKLFWVLIQQVFRGKPNIVVCEVSRNLKTAFICQWIDKYKNTLTKIIKVSRVNSRTKINTFLSMEIC